MSLRTFNNQSGIALGPILFILAILAILAGAIAAGAGSFTGGTSRETANVEASKIIDFGNRVYDAVQLMASTYQVPDYGWNAMHAGTGWSAQCLDATCSIWCDSPYLPMNGGSLNCIPDLVLPASDTLPFFSSYYSSESNGEVGNIQFVLIENVGTPGKGQIALVIWGVSPTICAEINRQLGFGSITPTESGYGASNYIITSQTITDPTGVAVGATVTQFAGQQQFCVGNGNFGSTEFDYVRVLVVR